MNVSVFSLSPAYSDLEAAPLLCAGLIGYRAYRRDRREGQERWEFTGLARLPHIIAQVARYQGRESFCFHPSG